MARNYEQHPFREALKDFGIIGVVLGGLAIAASGLEMFTD